MKFNTYDYANSDLVIAVEAEIESTDDLTEASDRITQVMVDDFFSTKAVLDEVDVTAYKLPQIFPPGKR